MTIKTADLRDMKSDIKQADRAKMAEKLGLDLQTFYDISSRRLMCCTRKRSRSTGT